VMVLTARDVPVNLYGLQIKDQPVLCGPVGPAEADIVRCVGDRWPGDRRERGASARGGKAITVQWRTCPSLSIPRKRRQRLPAAWMRPASPFPSDPASPAQRRQRDVELSHPQGRRRRGDGFRRCGGGRGIPHAVAGARLPAARVGRGLPRRGGSCHGGRSRPVDPRGSEGDRPRLDIPVDRCAWFIRRSAAPLAVARICRCKSRWRWPCGVWRSGASAGL